MNISAEPLGTYFVGRSESDVVELSMGTTGLRIVIDRASNQHDERMALEYHFHRVRGFRFLDEGDLGPFFNSGAFSGNYHLYQVNAGGWYDQEKATPGMLGISTELSPVEEWFVCTSNGCVSVLAQAPPTIREFD